MKHNHILLALAALSLTPGCAESPPGPDGGKGGKTGEEYTYITVPYQRKNNGAYPYGWETSLSTHTRTVAGMNWMEKKTAYELDRWGGNPDLEVTQVASGNTAGFWRTGKVGDRWYFINPDGNATVLHGLNGVLPDPARDTSTEETRGVYQMLFGGSVQRWAEYAGGVLADYGFNFYTSGPRRAKMFWDYFDENSIRAMQNPREGIENGHVEPLWLLRTFAWDYYSIYKVSFSTAEHNTFVLLFDPAFPDYLDELARTATAPFRDSKNLIGYYIDNELPFNSYQERYPLRGIELAHFLALEDKFAGQFAGARKYAQDFMREKFGVEPLAANITVEMRNEFRRQVARYYYKTTTEAIRRHDPNHLILGSRLFDSSMYSQYTVQACAEYCDVVSVNYYNYWQPTEEYCRGQLAAWIDKPFMVTEFYTKDTGAKYISTPYENVEGAGWIVENQKARGHYYQNFCIGLLETGNCVGWQWFTFMDDYGQGESTRWTGSNKGVVSARFEPYRDCLNAMRELNLNIYQIADYFDAKKKQQR